MLDLFSIRNQIHSVVLASFVVTSWRPRLASGLILAALTFGITGSLPADTSPPTKPAGLRRGDTIAFVAPAGETDINAVCLAQNRLEDLGFRVVVPKSIARRRGYLAGTDEERADELMDAFRDPDVDAVFPVTGGFGTTRMLDRLDYEVISQNPKVFIGFSDITGLHLALAARCNMVTFHSPNPEYGLGSLEGLKRFHAHYFWRCILANENQCASPLVYQPPQPDLPIKVIRPGVARGRTIGGNLSLIAALMGTPYEIEAAGHVLFLEDIREAPYRIDRMLSQLRLAGKLDHPAAVILGAFYKCDVDQKGASLSLDEVFDDYFASAPYPVIKDFPAGHGPWNATLPLNVLAEVDGDRAVVRVLENPVTPARAIGGRRTNPTVEGKQ